MLDTLYFAFNAVMPLMIMLAAGYAVKAAGLVPQQAVAGMNKIVFYILTPVLLFYNIYEIGSLSEVRWDIAIYAVAAVLVIFGVGVAAAAFVKDPRQKGVMQQCAFRSNYAIIGVALTMSVAGSAGVRVAAIVSMFAIPLYNVLAVVSLTVYLKGSLSFRATAVRMLHNPLIIGCLLGVATLVIRALMPAGADGSLVFTIKDNLPALYSALGSVAEAACPVALILVGAEFSFRAVPSLSKLIAAGTLLRLVVAPAIGIGMAVVLTKCGLISFGPVEMAAMVALFASPVAVNSAIMASAMDNDGQLADQLVVWTTLLSSVTMFIVVVILRTFSLI